MFAQFCVLGYQQVRARSHGRSNDEIVFKVRMQTSLLLGHPDVRVVTGHGSRELAHLLKARPCDLARGSGNALRKLPVLLTVRPLDVSRHEKEQVF